MSEGEIWEGFLILPDGVPLPDLVQPSEHGIPIVCGVGSDGPEPTAEGESFNRIEDLINDVEIPVYFLDHVPEELQLLGTSLIRHDESGELFQVAVDYGSVNHERNTLVTTVSLWSRPDFPRPFPLRFTEPVEDNGPAIILEKVDVLPSPGILVTTEEGHVFHWIENDVLYTLIAENASSREEAELLVDWLTRSN